MGKNTRSEPILVTAPSSYLALSEIISRLYAAPPQGDGLGPDWQALLADLPQTPVVSENAGTVVLDYAGKPYVRIKEKELGFLTRKISSKEPDALALRASR